ncbi:MAG: TetR/AcrR family transcriptional regulator [Methanobacteriaceae archaeon]|jgi:AcrR family transcriptional regulator|nr:TetR/AcrR family transcriptional regulator [Candidatus Methanorudis spinitermitis]
MQINLHEELGEIIYSRFNSLATEKKNRILNAAFKEFAKNGYEKASTNIIIKEANISKGSLFDYFGNKKRLYLFLLNYTSNLIANFYDEIDLADRDIFNRIEELSWVKLKIMKKFPEIFDFLKKASVEESNEIKHDIDKIKVSIVEDFKIMYENIDSTKFREDIDIQKAIDIINWSMLGFSDREIEKLDSFSNVDDKKIKEWEIYSNILKKCFYKE